MSIVRLLPANGHVAAGSIVICGVDVLSLSARAMRQVRGKRVGVIFQDSMTSLNPVLSVGLQITEAMQAHMPITRREARRKAVSLLEEVGVFRSRTSPGPVPAPGCRAVCASESRPPSRWHQTPIS